MGLGRGNAGAYDRYLAAMDAAMRVKVAGAAAHLLGSGRVADMGMGSGAGSFALASLYPHLEVVGVDLDPEMVARARATHVLPNLSFVVGDIADPPFERASLDGIFNSSVLHHVTSFGGYDHESAARALAAQTECLRPGGRLIVRDFLAPTELDDVWLELPCDDGDESDDPRTCSTAALFRRFATEFRALHHAPGFAFDEGAAPRPGWIRVRLARRHAVEFVLRKDYRTDWESEVREEYTYFDQDAFTEVFQRLGLRVCTNAPNLNPWIVRHRFEGRFRMFDLDEQRLAWPATNVLVAGERVEDDQAFTFDTWEAEPIDYLSLSGHVDRRTGLVLDLARRPGRTMDLVPYWRDAEEDLFVVARAGYPRPILAGSIGLDGSLAPAFLHEPIVVVRPAEGADLRAEVDAALAEHGLQPLGEPQSGVPYFPSAGAILERVEPVFVEVVPTPVPTTRTQRSGFASDGRLRSIDARQVLRAAEVGAMPDARLALHVRALHETLGLSPGPWIGAELDPPTAEVAAEGWPEADERAVFAPVDETGGFLEIEALEFTERDRSHRALACQVLESVRTTEHGDATLVLAMYARSERGLTVAIVDDDRPARQVHEGISALPSVPAYRVPEDVVEMHDALSFLRERVRARHGATLGALRPLGGGYYPAPGLTAELVHVVAAPLETATPGAWPEPLMHVSLADAPALADGHSRIAIARLRAALNSDEEGA